MRPLPALIVLILLLALLAGSPVAADEPIEIAVPDSNMTNGDLDVVVLTGQEPEVVPMAYCFPPGDYLMFRANLVDESAKISGVVDGAIATADVRGNLGDFQYNGTCYEPDGTRYKKYIQVP